MRWKLEVWAGPISILSRTLLGLFKIGKSVRRPACLCLRLCQLCMEMPPVSMHVPPNEYKMAREFTCVAMHMRMHMNQYLSACARACASARASALDSFLHLLLLLVLVLVRSAR